MYKIMLLTLVLIMFQGCTKIVYVSKPVYYRTKLPVKLTENITLPKPPNKELYITSSVMDKEDMLTTLIVSLYGTIGKYKIRMKKIKEFETNTTKVTSED